LKEDSKDAKLQAVRELKARWERLQERIKARDIGPQEQLEEEDFLWRQIREVSIRPGENDVVT